jgi:LmbE family N-acetylglucosaminyl deacetylase
MDNNPKAPIAAKSLRTLNPPDIYPENNRNRITWPSSDGNGPQDRPVQPETEAPDRGDRMARQPPMTPTTARTRTNVLDEAEIERILVITAHPDDVDFGAAGTIATWTDAGIEVVYCIVTDGDAGGSDPTVSRADMAVLRRAEQTAAAKCVGVTELRFLGYSDGYVEPTIALRKDLTRVIRQLRPDRVLTSSPERNYARVQGSHPDHRAVGSAALDAVYPAARNQFAFPELLADENLEPWTVREVWLLASPQADHYVDVTDTFDKKLAALRAHESQTGGMELETFLRAWLTRQAAMAELPEGRLAEAFQILGTA